MAVLTLGAVALAGCGSGYVYLRADGKDLSGDPALYQQFETDRMICQGEGHSTDGSVQTAFSSVKGAPGAAGVSQDCMADKGYLVVPADLAALKQQDLAAKAAEKAQREAAAAAPPPPPPPPPPVTPQRATAKPKPKPKPKPQQAQPTPQPQPSWPAPQAPPNWPAPQAPPS